MYLFLPVLYFFVRKNLVLWPLFLIWGFTVAMTVHTWWKLGSNDFSTVIPCFLMGVVAYVLFERLRPILPAWSFPLFLLAVTALYMLHPRRTHGIPQLPCCSAWACLFSGKYASRRWYA